MAEPLTYAQIISHNTPAFNASLDRVLAAINSGQITPAEFNANYAKYYGFEVTPQYTRLGKPLGFTFQRVSQSVTTNQINSNVTTVNRGTIRTPINTTVDAATQTVRSGRVLPPSGAPSTWSYVANSVASPIIAAGIGISLGKAIDSTLYNLNPSFWDANGMSALNPETWNSLTTGINYNDPVTGTAASLMNMILGLNPETGEATAYVDEKAYAYLAKWLYDTGVFEQSGYVITDDTPSYILSNPVFTDLGFNYVPMGHRYYSSNYNYCFSSSLLVKQSSSGVIYHSPYFLDMSTSGLCRGCVMQGNVSYIGPKILIASDVNLRQSGEVISNDSGAQQYSTGTGARSYTLNGKTVYYVSQEYTRTQGYMPLIDVISFDYNHAGEATGWLAWEMIYGNYRQSGGVEGITNQPNAQLPDTQTWGDYNNVLPSLQQQYPEIFGNPIPVTTVNPDGTTTTRNYVPIPLPSAKSNADTQPTSDTQTQPDIKIKPDVTPQPIIDLLTKVIQQPETEPFNPDPPAPPNPTDTGDDEEPVTPMPTGNATALWSIYHPTQSQINSFGAWLWSSDFIEQLKKIFNNPMESIIGLHKVYASPIDAGTSTIVVGYLDSEVPSAYITQQYVTIDCGTVDINETFGNVFDYSPYTVIKLYLPFVGIVELDPSEVMRSSVNIKYGVDVLTGACLAKVRVKRDGNSATLYQYAGNCAVQYPLSMGSYMGIVASIVGVAGSVAATVASGGSAAPLALGALGAAFNAKTNVQNSGSFTGNAGAMGGKKPYLIIERPQTKMASNQQAFIGQPTNEYKRLGNYNGFVKCWDAHITNVNATDDELSEIQNYLSNGVLV